MIRNRGTRAVAAGLAAGALCLWLASHATAEPAIAPDEVTGPQTWGSVDNVMTLHHLHISGQPAAEALEAAKAAGVSVVVNLRESSEMSWDEAAAVEALGMTYVHIPVPGREPFSEAVFAQIDRTVHEHESEQVWLHCASGNRVAAWLAVHVKERHDMSVDDALAVGRKAGITKSAIEQKVRAYVTARESETGSDSD